MKLTNPYRTHPVLTVMEVWIAVRAANRARLWLELRLRA